MVYTEAYCVLILVLNNPSLMQRSQAREPAPGRKWLLEDGRLWFCQEAVTWSEDLHPLWYTGVLGPGAGHPVRPCSPCRLARLPHPAYQLPPTCLLPFAYHWPLVSQCNCFRCLPLYFGFCYTGAYSVAHLPFAASAHGAAR